MDMTPKSDIPKAYGCGSVSLVTAIISYCIVMYHERNIDNKYVLYSQHSIFFVTYESDQLARLFHITKLKGFTSAKHFNLLGQLLSYEENEVLWICTLFFDS